MPASPASRPLALLAALALALPAAAATPPEAEPDADAEPAAEPEPAPAPTAAGPTATGDAKLALLAPAINGPIDEGAAPRLIEHLQKGLALGAFAVIAPAELAPYVSGECEGAACVTKIRKGTGAAYVLRTRITINDRDYLVRLDLLEAKEGDVVASSEERCDLCGLAEVGALLEAQSARLRAKLEDLIKGPPILVISSTPAGAMVFIDNQLVGATPLERTMVEGEHVVRVMFEGYIPDEREVALVAGVRSNVEVALRRTPETAKFRAIGWATLALGIPFLAATPALLYFDGRPFARQCDGDDIDIDGDCRFLVNTDWTAVLTAGAGAALVTVGTVLLLRTRDRGRPRRAAKVSAGIGPGGFSLRGSF